MNREDAQAVRQIGRMLAAVVRNAQEATRPLGDALRVLQDASPESGGALAAALWCHVKAQAKGGRLGGRKRWKKRKPVDSKALAAAVDKYLKANPHWGLTGAKDQVAHDFRVSVRKVEQARHGAK